MNNKLVEKFMKRINKEMVIAEISPWNSGIEEPDTKGMLKFELKLKETKYFNRTTSLSKAANYYTLIENVVLEMFCDAVDFNNTGDIFFFFDRSEHRLLGKKGKKAKKEKSVIKSEKKVKPCKTCAVHYPCAKNITYGTKKGCPEWQPRECDEESSK